jgi:DDE superfamily endonuclease
MDGFGAHTHDGVLRRLNGEYNTEVVILPPNTSYRLQPLDGGPNRSFKAFMRRQLRRRMIDIEQKGAPTDADMCVVAVQGLIVFLILCSSGIYHPRVHQEILLSTVWRGRQSGTRFD